MPEVELALEPVSESQDSREGLHHRFSNLIQASRLVCSWQSKGASCTKWSVKVAPLFLRTHLASALLLTLPQPCDRLVSSLLLSLLIGAILLQQQFRVPSFIPGGEQISRFTMRIEVQDTVVSALLTCIAPDRDLDFTNDLMRAPQWPPMAPHMVLTS